MYTSLDYSLRKDEREQEAYPNMENPTENRRRWSNLKNRWERFRGWERAEEVRRRDTTRRDVEFEGRAWRTPVVQIMARSARSGRHGFREESHRSVIEEVEEKKNSWQTPDYRRKLRFVVSFATSSFFRVLFSFVETNRTDSVPDFWFMMRSF